MNSLVLAPTTIPDAAPLDYIAAAAAAGYRHIGLRLARSPGFPFAPVVGNASLIRQIRQALARFKGVHRRFEYVVKNDGVVFIDDYAHHPQELAALQMAAAVQAGPDVPDAVFNFAREHFSDRQLVELVGLVGYYWMLGRIATVFQVDLDVAQGTEVYDAGLQLAAGKE